LDLAVGQPQPARTRLTDMRAVLQKNGMTLADLECRAQLVLIDRAEGRSTAVADAATLTKDAQARGAGMIQRRLRDAATAQLVSKD
jgi:hypothetical protein